MSVFNLFDYHPSDYTNYNPNSPYGTPQALEAYIKTGKPTVRRTYNPNRSNLNPFGPNANAQDFYEIVDNGSVIGQLPLVGANTTFEAFNENLKNQRSQSPSSLFGTGGQSTDYTGQPIRVQPTDFKLPSSNELGQYRQRKQGDIGLGVSDFSFPHESSLAKAVASQPGQGGGSQIELGAGSFGLEPNIENKIAGQIGPIQLDAKNIAPPKIPALQQQMQKDIGLGAINLLPNQFSGPNNESLLDQLFPAKINIGSERFQEPVITPRIDDTQYMTDLGILRGQSTIDPTLVRGGMSKFQQDFDDLTRQSTIDPTLQPTDFNEALRVLDEQSTIDPTLQPTDFDRAFRALTEQSTIDPTLQPTDFN